MKVGDGSEAMFLSSVFNGYWSGVRQYHFGWPCNALDVYNFGSVEKSGETRIDDVPQRDFHVGAISFDIATALAVLFGSACISESLIRRRAARKAA